MDRSARQKLNRGYADGLARGLELAVVPVVFGGLGWLLDRWLSTGKVFTIALAVFGVVGIFVKMWLQYDAERTREEEGAIWNRGPRAAAPAMDAGDRS